MFAARVILISTFIVVVGVAAFYLLPHPVRPVNASAVGFDPTGTFSGVRVFTDDQTGCQYLSLNHELTPRLLSDGHPLCSR